MYAEPRIDCNLLATLMRQRRSGTEHVYCSNIRFCYQWQSYLNLESTENVNT